MEEEELILKKVRQVDFVHGDLFLFDKPKKWTSFDVVNKVRRSISRSIGRRIKVGHAGTLDPLASGLLLLAFGRNTKQIRQFQGLDKTYEGIMKLGATTPCYDSEMEENQQFPTDHIDEALILAESKNFIGEIHQAVPIFSAVKVDGKRLYELARKGEAAPVKSRDVFVHKFDIDKVEMPLVEFTVKCSKGTYIRSLANDLGAKLNSGAYLTELRRTDIGIFSVKDAWQIDKFVSAMKNFKPTEK